MSKSPTLNSDSKTVSTPQVVKTSNKGLLTALGAFFIWGCFPFYFKQLGDYNAFEVIVHRIVWTFVCLFVVLLIGKRWSWVGVLKRNPRLLLVTFISSLLITINWLTYVWAVNADQILAASIGYFISPLFGILMSLVVLKERLRILQWLAVGLASLAVLIQIVWLGSLPWVALVLAATFSIYGLMQRRTPLPALEGLFVETALVLPLCLYWLVGAGVASSQLSFWWSSNIWLLMLAGPVTLVPLLLFNKSTKMVAYSILSFMQYLTPTFIFLLAVFYYREPFDSQRLIVFGLIWIGLLVFSIDLWNHRPAKLVQKKA